VKLLIYQLGSLGDTVISLPAYRAVRHTFGPAASIQVLHNLPEEGRVTPQQLLEGSGLVDAAIGFRQARGAEGLPGWLELRRRLVSLQFDAAVYFAPAERPATAVKRDRLFFRLCGIRRLIGFKPIAPARFTAHDSEGRYAPVAHEAFLRLERLQADGIEVRPEIDLKPPLLSPPPAEMCTTDEWLRARRQAPDRLLVAVCPGANQQANFWPRERFVEIGRRLIADGRFEPLVVGGPAERAAGDEMVTTWGLGLNAAGQFSPLGSAALLRRCAFLIGLDTGTTHLAAAVGIPCVALYGDRNPPGQWFPLGEGHRILQHRTPCGGCRHSLCPLPAHPCMHGITVDTAWSAILAMAQAI
jgi:ADP-heptose:LPS heptosyltransferase